MTATMTGGAASKSARKPARRATPTSRARKPAPKAVPKPKKSSPKAGAPARSVRERASDALDSLGNAAVPLAVVAVTLVVLVALYGPARGLYCAWRDQGIKQETLDGLNESIDEYQGDIDRLQTREGIEDEARKRGYVNEGESGVKAVGLPEDDDAAPESEELPWYLSLGDFVFRYGEE